MILYAATIFLGAFLLFQVQPIIAKAILPWFGGSAAVWATCMVFFQVGLLGGYYYTHYSIGRITPKRQAIIHTILLAVSLIFLPILPAETWKPAGGENPTVRILLLLALTVGLPYVLLSTTGPLVQAWYARARKGAIPYRLFALSNLGSMLALLSYPFLIEPYFPTSWQGRIWSAAYVVFGVLCVTLAWRSSRFEPLTGAPAGPAEEVSSDDSRRPSTAEKVYWVALAACASALMLAVTNHLTQDVASIPFLWILPLSLYLLSFILTFDTRGWYKRDFFLLVLAPALGGMAYLRYYDSTDLGITAGIAAGLTQIGLASAGQAVARAVDWLTNPLGAYGMTIALFSVALFVCCMFRHGELVQRKPSPKHLTSFYLMLSIGGALGGLFVGLAAPYVFNQFHELPIAIAFCALLAVRGAIEEPGVSLGRALRTVPALALLLGMAAIWLFLGYSAYESVQGYRVVQRNFYGTIRVSEAEGAGGDFFAYRTLLHGSINHGEQWTHPERRREQLTYYCADAGIGRAMNRRKPEQRWKVGVIGLGAGSMASFGREGDEFRFYEIDPQVPVIATTEFTYYTDAPSKNEIVLGDGRLSLEREPAQNYDVLMMDAFSGDSIPVHLVTREAFQTYLRHVKETGVIVVHISNKYLNLEPVLARVSEEFDLPALMFETDDSWDGNCFGTSYVIFAKDQKTLKEAIFENAGRPLYPQANVAIWTDDYSNMFRILR